jgi:hypothetical protein
MFQIFNDALTSAGMFPLETGRLLLVNPMLNDDSSSCLWAVSHRHGSNRPGTTDVDVVLLPFAKPIVSFYGTCQHALAV